jgi:DNA-binding transcriptional MerR regulator/methylmalonyl-CoA mutase cobalamin-binding subunit
MNSESSSATLSSISDVERDTGIAKETLRVWERRYAFPTPGRDHNGERLYPADQVQRLRLVKRLLDQGYRPGKVIQLGSGELAELAGKVATRAPEPDGEDPDIKQCLAMIRAHKMVELRQRLAQTLLQKGLRGFVIELVAPLSFLVGEAWSAGKLAVFEEHLYAETLQSFMRNAIFSANQQIGQANASPRILLTTVPQERHGLGLLMAEALFTLEGAHCVSLGVQTPLNDIVQAARVQEADIVALSFSSVMSPRAAVDNISELQSRLGASVQVWAGGSCAALARRQLGPQCVLDLNDIPGAVSRWRSQNSGAQA